MNNVDFDNLYTIIDSLKKIYSLIISASSKIVTQNNLKLYRVVSTNKKTDSISKGNIISTTLNKDMVDSFVINKYNSLYKIEANSKINALVIPYSILIDEKFGKLELQKDDKNLQEVIIFKDDIDISIDEVKEIDEYIKVFKISTEKKKMSIK